MTDFPLTWRSLQFGAIAGLLTGFVAETALVGYAVFVLCVSIGMTLRSDEAPVFPFVLALQWLQVTSGYIFWVVTGVIPSFYPAGDIDHSVQLALTGLLVLALGIRLSQGVFRQRQEFAEPPAEIQNLTGLFWLVIGLYAINYVATLNTKAFGGFQVILESFLLTRQIPLLLLWFAVLRQRQHRLYLWISLVWVFIPALGSYFSDFKIPLLLLLIVSASAWRPWETTWWRFGIASTARTIAIAAAVLFLALIWQAGVKRDTRKAYNEAAVSASSIGRMEFFLTSASTAVPRVFAETQDVVEELVSRVWYIVFFSRVLEYVPAVEPHAHGELLQMAITNSVVPRFLFPDKPALPSDSCYTRRFAGINVAEQNASISIGYMAEFYADWGIFGMFVSVFAYGALMGGAAHLVKILIRSRTMLDPALITVLMTVSFFEQQFIKMLGALTIALIVTSGVIWIGRRPFERFLKLKATAEPAEHEVAFTPTPATGRGPRRTALAARRPVL